MKSAWLVRTSVTLAFVALACHDSPSGTKGSGTGGDTGVPFLTLTVDSLVPYNAGPEWGGLNLFLGANGSASIVSMDYGNNRLRYAHCDTNCDARTAWKTLTVDSGGNDYLNSGAAVGSGGVYAVYQQSGVGIRYAHCATGCDTAANWQASTLFAGFIGSNGPHVNPLTVDGSGVLHLIYETTAPALIYARCASNCGNGASWSQTKLDSAGLEWSIATEPSGRLDLVYSTWGGLTYLSCDTGCTTGSNWARAVIDAGGARSTAMALAGGVLHVAYADTIDAVHYKTCSATCTTPASWTGALIGQTSPNDVSIGAGGGRVAIATSQSQLVVSSCMTVCTNAPAWQSVAVDSARTAGGGYLSLGIDNAGLPRVASTVTWLQYTRVTQ